MSAELPVFTQEEMAIDEAQGFPKAYALLCKTSVTNGPFSQGPPISFIPYALKSQEALRVKELNQMFPVINQEVCSSEIPRSFENVLWEKLDHLGNAGFEPALFRVDCFGNVVYRRADSASPLAWDIDHWFPSSRGGKTVPSNLRILQWQVCEKKKNKLDFLIPWWDLQLGVSINQFLSIFVSKNSDFRSRAFSFLFPDGGGEELNCLQNLHLHSFPHNFMKAIRKQGFAPAAIVLSQNSSETMTLKAVDLNRSLIKNPPFPASLKSFQADADNKELQNFRSSISKENNQPAIDDHESNPYLTISCARDSLRQRKEASKQQEEINKLDEMSNELKQKNDIEQISLQELEAKLIRRRRKVEKFRRLSEAQASYRTLLEKMIRDAMHQNVVYKEQLRLNQAASSVLMARLESQRAACDSSENEVRRKYKQREELERHTMGSFKQTQHRSHIYDDFHEASKHLEAQRAACDSFENEIYGKYKQRDELERCRLKQISHRSHIYDDLHEGSEHSSSIRRVRRPPKKELRVFLQEEQKAFEAGISLSFNDQEESEETKCIVNEEEDYCQPSEVNKINDGFVIGEKSDKRIVDNKATLNNVQEGYDKLLVSMDHDLTTNNKPKKILHMELNVIESDKSCRRINDQKRQMSQPCVSINNIEGHDAILVNNKLKQDQKRGIDSIKANKSKLQWNLHPSSHEQQEENEEYRNRVGKRNVDKWLQILLGNADEGSQYSDSHPTSSSACTVESKSRMSFEVND